jgi:hypothetical protein
MAGPSRWRRRAALADGGGGGAPPPPPTPGARDYSAFSRPRCSYTSAASRMNPAFTVHP